MQDQARRLVPGTVDILILKTLVEGPEHGFGVSRSIRDRTDGVLEVEDAALYQALHRMERKGWVESEWGLSENNRRAKYYQITRAGARRLQEETSSLRAYVQALFKVLESA